MSAAIRTELPQLFSSNIAATTRILYGGPVKANNAFELLQQEDVDSTSLSGASLDAAELDSIVTAAT
ncbi:triose-phosphate isomerase [Arthrobacter sp. ISL-30]|uniref:triose-phosphate isomerase n=1 Tax=Arthrobacter sp. ISL-30 TaxID=2819109 RepID=UPI00203653FA|nr:triose-phosphate isomerase [Arthrobacter sp. ISL-30]